MSECMYVINFFNLWLLNIDIKKVTEKWLNTSAYHRYRIFSFHYSNELSIFFTSSDKFLPILREKITKFWFSWTLILKILNFINWWHIYYTGQKIFKCEENCLKWEKKLSRWYGVKTTKMILGLFNIVLMKLVGN